MGFCEHNKEVLEKVWKNHCEKYLNIMKQAAAIEKLSRMRRRLVGGKESELRKSDG